MSEPSVWRARGYWALATVLLPSVNPVLWVWAGFFRADRWIPVALLLAAADGVLLWLLAGKLWKKPEMRRWRAALATFAAIPLSVLYGAIELYVVLTLSCPESGCFN